MSELDWDNEGWVPLHRRCLRSQMFANPHLWKVWTWCKLRAAHRTHWISFKAGRGNTEIQLKEGQFVFGRYSAANELNMKPSTVWRYMKKLEKINKVNIQSDRHYSIITVCDKEEYKYVKYNVGQRNEHTSDSNKTGKEQAVNTNNNDKNEKKNKKSSFSDPIYPTDIED